MRCKFEGPLAHVGSFWRISIIGCISVLLVTSEKGNEIKIHWVPGHKEVEGNEIANRQGNEAARKKCTRHSHIPVLPILDKEEAVSELKKQMAEKWQRKFIVAISRRKGNKIVMGKKTEVPFKC